MESFDLSKKDAARAKNMFALGLLSWMYGRPTEGTLKFLQTKFAKKPEIMNANIAAFKAGWNFGETTEDFAVSYEVKPAALPAGRYRNITGNLALSYGLIAASKLRRSAAVPRLLPDHSGLGHPARTQSKHKTVRCSARSRPRRRSRV